MGKYRIQTVKEIKAWFAQNTPRFEVVSFFAGGGGSSTGYRMAGGKVLAVNEFIHEARETYHANWPDTTIIPDDIRKLTASDILKTIGKEPRELDILDGSPPCCAFSTQGKRDKGWGNEVKKYSDGAQSNIEDLFFDYIRMVDGIRPKVFVAENVSGLIKGVAKGYFNQILRAMRHIGYHVECKLLNSAFLGVPQKRERVIFVGVRNDLWKDEYTNRLHPKPVNRIVTLAEAFDGLVNDPDDLQNSIPSPSSKTYWNMTHTKIGHDGITFNAMKKMSPNKPCNTVTTVQRGGPFHWDNRFFTVKEAKRITSIPDDYILTGRFAQQYERLGRMVPPLMMKAVAENIYNVILKELR